MMNTRPQPGPLPLERVNTAALFGHSRIVVSVTAHVPLAAAQVGQPNTVESSGTGNRFSVRMNPLTPSLSPTGGEGGRRPGEGASRSSREQCAFKVRGVLAPSQRVRMRASLPLSLDFVLPVLLVLWLLTISTASAAEPAKAQLDFFENKIRPIFADNCYKCHSPANGKIKGGLELD